MVMYLMGLHLDPPAGAPPKRTVGTGGPQVKPTKLFTGSSGISENDTPEIALL